MARDNIVMVRRIRLLNGRTFTVRYGRARRVNLPEIFNLKRKYKMRAAAKNKKWRVRRGREIGLTLGRIIKSPIVKN